MTINITKHYSISVRGLRQGSEHSLKVVHFFLGKRLSQSSIKLIGKFKDAWSNFLSLVSEVYH